MKIRLLPIMLVFAVCTAATGTDAPPPSRFRLSSVRFIGIKGVDRGELAAQLVTRMPPLWKFWLQGPVLTDLDLEDDRLRIRQYYEKNGYYHTQVAVTTGATRPAQAENGERDAEQDTSLPRVAVTFEIDEGRPVVVTSIQIKGMPSKPPMPDAWQDTFPLKEKQVFRVEDYEAAKEQISRHLADHGYPFAQVNGKATVNTVENHAEVMYAVDSGKRCRFGSVVIAQGDNPVAEKTIRRGLAFESNEIYSASKIEKSRQNLIELDVFRLVVFETGDPPPEDGGPVAIRLTLTSKKRHSLRTGIGYGTEEELRLQAAWTYRNVFGHAASSTLSGKYSALIERINLDVEQPYVWDAKTKWYGNAGYEKEKFPAYTNRKILAKTGLSRRHWQDVTGNLGYSLEFNEVTDADLAALAEAELEAVEEDDRFLVSSLFTQLIRDTRDDLLDPEQGSLVAGSFEWASRLFGSELQFIKPALEGRIYYPLVENLVGTFRLRLESIQETESSDFIPISKRLFLGGSNTVRGYRFQDVPPLDAVGNPVGGRTALNTNIELRFPVYGALSGVVFLDTGLIDPDSFSLDFSRPWYAAGLGIRYDTVVGPLRVDWGYKINPPKGSDIGDEDDPDGIVGDRWRLHFSIGQTF